MSNWVQSADGQETIREDTEAIAKRFRETLLIIANLDPHTSNLLEAQNYARDAIEGEQ